MVNSFFDNYKLFNFSCP